MRLNSTEVVEQRTLAQKDDAGVHMVVPAGTTGTTTAVGPAGVGEGEAVEPGVVGLVDDEGCADG